MERVRARSRKYNPTISTARRLPTPHDTTVAFYPLCKSMQNNAAVLPAQSDADVACMYAYAYGQERTTSTSWSQVKTHLSPRARLDGYFASTATREGDREREGRPVSSGINVVCTTFIFSRGATYLHETRARAGFDKGRKSISGALFARFYTQ